MAAASRKLYRAVAEVLAQNVSSVYRHYGVLEDALELTPEAAEILGRIRAVAEDLADVFATNDPRFDVDRFLIAADVVGIERR